MHWVGNIATPPSLVIISDSFKMCFQPSTQLPWIVWYLDTSRSKPAVPEFSEVCIPRWRNFSIPWCLPLWIQIMCRRMLTKIGQAINMHGHNVSLVIRWGGVVKYQPSCGVCVKFGWCQCKPLLLPSNFDVLRLLWQTWAGYHKIHEIPGFPWDVDVSHALTYSSQHGKSSPWLVQDHRSLGVTACYGNQGVILNCSPSG